MFSSWFASFFFWEHKLVRFHFGTSIRRLLIFKKDLDYWNPQILKPGHSVLGLGEDYFHLGPKIARRSTARSPCRRLPSLPPYLHPRVTDDRPRRGRTADGPVNPGPRSSAPFPILRSASPPPAAAWRGVRIHPGPGPIASLLAGKEP